MSIMWICGQIGVEEDEMGRSSIEFARENPTGWCEMSIEHATAVVPSVKGLMIEF